MDTSLPVEPSDIELPEEIRPLVEGIAANVHAEWVRQREDGGWKYGPKRDDDLKTHPCLVDFSELPENEKQIDRATAELTIKSLLALGYRVVNPGTAASDQALNSRALSEGVLPESELNKLLSKETPLREAIETWNRLGAVQKQCPLAVHQALARRLLSNGTPVAAIDVLRRGLDYDKDDLLLNQLHGLALARIGESQRANRIFKDVVKQLEKSPSIDPDVYQEVLGGLGRTYKDLGLTATSVSDRSSYLHKSLNEYSKAYEVVGGYWVGINQATLAILVGEIERGRMVAEEVVNQCTPLLDDNPNDYWLLATLGEASLVSGDMAAAERWYRAAAEASEHRFGDINTTRRQARLLLEAAGEDASVVDEWLPVPKVVVFAGLPIDRPGQKTERFPPRLEAAIRQSLKQWLLSENARIGFSSASCGSPIIFQEVLAEIGGECHVVLPYEDDFVKERILERGDESWVDRFDKVISRAEKVTYASMERIEPERVTYDYATLVTHGLATIRAHELQTNLAGLSVWDGKPGWTEAATSIVIKRWQHLGVPVSRIDMASVPTAENSPLSIIREAPVGGPDPQDSPPGIDVMAMLFGDAVNFSKLTEDQVPRFVQHFLGAVRAILDQYSDANVVRNTWGDGLYLVFKHVRDAGLFALDLQKRVAETNWYDLDLPENLNVRLALHAGPVFSCTDPVTGQPNYTGRHVSRAARLEPKTPPGYVFASEAFAALAAAEKVTEFTCDYVRQLEWAKTYGTFPTYLLRKQGTRA